MNEWKIYFDELLNSRNINDVDFEIQIRDYMAWHDNHCEECIGVSEGSDTDDELNRQFTVGEVEVALNELVKGKSPGMDGITNDIMKNASTAIVPLLCKLYNAILDSGQFPEQWSHALIVPIYKNGHCNIPDNYRGISLLS